MQLLENISLKRFNTFSIDARARYFAAFTNVDQLTELTTHDSRPSTGSGLTGSDSPLPTLTLGGGSNILFTKDYDGLILKNEIKGIEKIKEDEDSVYITAGAGENWHQFVMYCIENGWAGIENLSLIPGCVGASPMQNIGAYGVEISSVFHELKAFHLEERSNYTFTGKDCEFGYRDSVFKGRYKDQFVILNVTFRLSKKPVFHTSYGAVQQELENMGISELSIKAISDAVVRIRSAKLPDPVVIGNAGSFFKNPTVSKEKYLSLRSRFENIVGYENADGTVKLAAAWMIEQCGWKGYRRGDAGCHEKQALVLVNYCNASGGEVYALSREIHETVREKFGVNLETEVNII